jgi:DNA-binding NarL/FixJ family response regulator
MRSVVIIEDNIITAEILKKQVNHSTDYYCDAYYTNPKDYLKSNESPDIIILDIMMPEMNGLDAMEKIFEKNRTVSIVINTSKEDKDTILKAMEKGAVGFIDKNVCNNNLIDVLKCLDNGGAYLPPNIAKKVIDFLCGRNSVLDSLSEREMEIANSMLKGKSYKHTADELFISIDTVRTYVRRIYKKLNVNSRSELFNLFN